MGYNQVAEFLRQKTPAHFKDICGAVDLLSDELEYTKAALSKDLISAQSRDDYAQAREILDMQEELSRAILSIREFLDDNDTEDAQEDISKGLDETEQPQAEMKRPDYRQYGTDDTVAYDIENTPVTFKRPAAFSLNGKRYTVTKWKTLFSKLCDLLYEENPTIIQNMVNEARQPGKKRVKMSFNKTDLHRPVKIANSDIWLETNRSAANIREAILTLLERYGIPANQVKVYFRRDYAALHADDGNNL